MRKAMSLCFLLALALVFVTGCSKKKQAVQEEDASTEAAEAWEEGGGEEATPEGGGEEAMPEGGGEGMEEGGDAEPMPEPEAMPEPEPAKTPEEVVAAATADSERADVMISRFRDLAEAKDKAGDLDGALDLYKRILLIDPSDEGARAAYGRLRAEAGESVPMAVDIVGTEAERVEANKQQTSVEIRRRLDRARQKEDEGDYDGAIDSYEQILAILNWYKYQADFPITSEQTRARIERARADQQREEARKEAETIADINRTEEDRAQKAKQEEIQQMKYYLQLASDSYDRGDYDLAQAHAQKVLALDPKNRAAQDLIRVAKETKYTADRTLIRERFNDEWKMLMESAELHVLPHTDLIRYPKNWAEISQRTPRGGVGRETVGADDPRTEQIRNALSTKRVFNISWEAGDITLEGAIKYLRSVTGLNFVLSQKVKDEKADTEIDLKVDNIAVSQVLDIVTEPNEMAWQIRNGVVMILDQSEALDKPILQFYDVKDLVVAISDFPGQEINLIPSRYQPPEEDFGDDDIKSPFQVDQLIEVIRTTIEPESWDEIEGADIVDKNNVLVVTTTPTVHRRIGSFLSDLRKHTGLLISLEVRFLLAEDRFLRDVGVDMRGLGDQTGGVGVPGLGAASAFDDSFSGSVANPSGTPPGVIPEPSSIGTSKIPGVFYSDGGDGEYKGRVENLFDFILQWDERGQATQSATTGGALRGDNSGGFTLQHVFLDDTQFEVILRAVEKTERIEEISAPRLTVYDTQRANVSVMTQNSYVQDFDVEIAQAAAIGDPIIQTIRDGIILDVRPIVSADRRFITMEMRPTVADLVRPIPTFQTSLATGPPVTIQVPEITISRVRTTVTMPDGGTLLLGGLKYFKDATADSGVPVLSNIPVVSFLFSRKAKIVQRRNLLILVKAQVVVPEEFAPDLGVQ